MAALPRGNDPGPAASNGAAPNWTLLSNHGHVLLCVARNPQARIRDLAEKIGITERACYRIISDLVEAGLLVRERRGRNNHYLINGDAPMLHPAWSEIKVARLISVVNPETSPSR